MLREGVTLNLSKSTFAQSSLRFCGEIIGSGLRRPDPDKVAAVHRMQPPQTKKQLRGILGFFSYFRKFIPNFAAKAKPLTDLTSKRVPQNIQSLWTAEHTVVLVQLKADLIQACNHPLHTVKFDRPFDIYVDASASHVGGILVQADDQGVEYPVAFFSNKLTPTQRNWATIEREAYAVLQAVKKYKQWICNTKVTVHSDHNPLTFLTSTAPKSAKLMRWSLALAEFNLEFKYRSGKSNIPADTLSRPGPE